MKNFGWVAFAVLALSGCQSDEECKSFGGGNDGNATWDQCGDKKTRSVKCTGIVRGALETPGKPAACTCSVEGVVGKTFQVNDASAFRSKESAAQLANWQCGWQLK